MLHYIPMDGSHLLEVQFARKHNDISKLCVELQRLGVGDVQLGGEVHLNTLLTGILHHGYIRSDDRIHTGFAGVVDDSLHHRNVFGVDDRIDCQVGFDTRFTADLNNPVQVIGREVCSRARTHVQVLNAEINAVRTRLDGSRTSRREP